MIKRTIISTIDGYKYIKKENENVAVQFQSLFLNKDKNKYEQKTVKLHKLLTENELDSLVGKIVKFDNVEEFNIDNNTYFSANDFEVLEDVNDIDFKLEKTAEIKLLNVFVQEVKDKENVIVLQTKIMLNKALKLENFKLKQDVFSEDLYNKLTALVGKKLMLKDIKETNFNNKTYYSTTSKPTVLK